MRDACAQIRRRGGVKSEERREEKRREEKRREEKRRENRNSDLTNPIKFSDKFGKKIQTAHVTYFFKKETPF